jgi:tetratricopeptide (TPR) repeat protein
MNGMARKAFFGSILVILPIQLFSQDWEAEIRERILDGNFDEVIHMSDSICPADSLKAKLNYYRGKAFESTFRYDSAYHSYSRAARADSLHPVYRLSMGQMLSRLGRTGEAIEIYEDLRLYAHLDNRSLTELAALYSSVGKYNESLLIYQKLLEHHPQNYYYLKQAGRCYQALNEPDSALTSFLGAAKLNPADAYLTHQIANIYLKKKDLTRAMSHLQEGFRYDTANLDLLKLRGYLWLLLDVYRNAIRDFEQARIQDSTSVFIQKYLGLSYHEEKMFDEARKNLHKAFEADSTDAETAYFLGSSCRWSGFEEQGVDYYLKSIELREPDPEAMKNTHLQLAELYKVLHQFEEAFDGYLEALKFNPGDPVIYYKIGQMLDRNLDRKREAIQYYEKYLNGEYTGHQLFNRSDGSSRTLRPYVEKRINELNEELFFENQCP